MLKRLYFLITAIIICFFIVIFTIDNPIFINDDTVIEGSFATYVYNQGILINTYVFREGTIHLPKDTVHINNSSGEDVYITQNCVIEEYTIGERIPEEELALESR